MTSANDFWSHLETLEQDDNVCGWILWMLCDISGVKSKTVSERNSKRKVT